GPLLLERHPRRGGDSAYESFVLRAKPEELVTTVVAVRFDGKPIGAKRVVRRVICDRDVVGTTVRGKSVVHCSWQRRRDGAQCIESRVAAQSGRLDVWGVDRRDRERRRIEQRRGGLDPGLALVNGRDEGEKRCQ